MMNTGRSGAERAQSSQAMYSPLLENTSKMNVRTNYYTPMPFGSSPYQRSISEYIRYGYVSLDKPNTENSIDIVKEVKNILRVKSIDHAGPLNKRTSGCLVVCLENATSLIKCQESLRKEYVVTFRLQKNVTKSKISQTLEKLRGALFQRPQNAPGTSRYLIVKNVYDNMLRNYDAETKTGIFWISCEAGSHVKSFCSHLGLLLGTECTVIEVRRIKTGIIFEKEHMFRLKDVKEAQELYDECKQDILLRTLIQPLECLLKFHKRIIVKDSAVNAICYGAKVTLLGVLLFDDGIELYSEVVVVTTKGEAICLAIALMTTATMATCDHGYVARIKNLIMERDTYPRQWGLGPRATYKKMLMANGQLDQYGKPNIHTPREWFLSRSFRKLPYSTAFPAEREAEVKRRKYHQPGASYR